MEMKNIAEHKVYNIIKVKNKYGFRVLLRFDDGTEEIRQFSGFDSKKDANSEKEKIIAQLVTKTFIVPKKQSVSSFLTEWLETDIKPRTTANTYSSYKNAIKNHILPILGKMYLTDLMRVHIKNMYIAIAEKSHRMAQIVKNIMNTSMRYAVNKGLISESPAANIPLPKNVAKNAYHTRLIKESNTLNLEQIVILINASRGMKNDFNLKAISKILGHAKEIVTADIYVDNREIITDGVAELKEYMEEVIPEKPVNFNETEKVFDHSDVDITAVFCSLTA
ncbi:MAG: N-terminal phage integrase SAM-like domain-containing protein [Acutalibacteraceae bacterium]|nr:N-terminal phage integrase SAM-like domain-containing protein [Acutalibacteraceae bacterium]